MGDLFPVFSRDDCQLHEELFSRDIKAIFSNRLSDQGLKDFIVDLSKNDYFKDLTSSYYSIEQFNSKVSSFSKCFALSVFYLNVRSLNSKVYQFCMLYTNLIMISMS